MLLIPSKCNKVFIENKEKTSVYPLIVRLLKLIAYL